MHPHSKIGALQLMTDGAGSSKFNGNDAQEQNGALETCKKN
jgi:hypothetical protein